MNLEFSRFYPIFSILFSAFFRPATALLAYTGMGYGRPSFFDVKYSGAKPLSQMISPVTPTLTYLKFSMILLTKFAGKKIKDRPELKDSRWVGLKNQQNQKESQAVLLDQLTVKKLHLKISPAYHSRLNFQELYQQPTEAAEAFLKKWYFWATHSRLEPIENLPTP